MSNEHNNNAPAVPQEEDHPGIPLRKAYKHLLIAAPAVPQGWQKLPHQRWVDGDEHDPRSEALYKFISDMDFNHCGDSFCFKKGGDGDNGETLMYILDC